MNSYCNNCGKTGHLFHQCKSPIISYGIIAFRENPTKNYAREYLLIRRKDTLGFVDFMRGKYSVYNKEYILNMIKQMTNDEKRRLITEQFSKLWDDLWGIHSPNKLPSSVSVEFTDLFSDETSSVSFSGFSFDAPASHLLKISDLLPSSKSVNPIESSNSYVYSPALILRSGIDHSSLRNCPLRVRTNSGERCSQELRAPLRNIDPYKAEETCSKNKFESLRTGIYTKTDFYNLEDLVKSTDQNWTEAEWGFPKGRRNYQERDYDCAVREFCEETGYSLNNLIPIKNIQPFEEIFTGSNYKSYKHKYYVTYMKYSDTLSSRRLQTSEVSDSEWMPIAKCCESIRHYNVEKLRLILAVENMLNANCLSKMCT